MIETREKEIDGFKVEVSQLPAFKSLRMSTRLGKLFGPAVTAAISGLNVSNLSDVDLKVIGPALSGLFENVSENEIEKLAKDLLDQATLNDAPFVKTCDLVLAGHPMTLLKCIVFALEVNYSDFFDAFRALGARVKVKASESKSPNTSGSAGLPGGST